MNASMHIPMSNVDGKVAFITGGASGIGLGIACAFAEAGMKVVIGDINREHIDDAMRCLKQAGALAHAICVDVTDRMALESAAAEAAETFGCIHVLVSNAGVQNPATLSSTSYEEWDKLIGVNFGGVFNSVRAFLPHVSKHGEGGHIVTTASMLGLFAAGPGYTAYCASKFGVVGLMESLQVELRDVNIGVSILCPGPVKTNLEKFLADYPLALEPLAVGRLVLRGMQRNEFYILTHPEFNPIIQCRNEAIIAATPKDLKPSEERAAIGRAALEACIYRSERFRPAVASDHL
jgi:NAD(P)-dependent dehydrogenase (short-subunit alcohol dehydrogenase family)